MMFSHVIFLFFFVLAEELRQPAGRLLADILDARLVGRINERAIADAVASPPWLLLAASRGSWMSASRQQAGCGSSPARKKKITKSNHLAFLFILFYCYIFWPEFSGSQPRCSAVILFFLFVFIFWPESSGC